MSEKRQILVIEPGKSYRDYWADMWRYRELFMTLAWRDISVRYKQTILGVVWAVLRPLLTMLIFTVIFGRVAGLPSEGDAPYALMVLVGLTVWTLFSTAIHETSNSLVSNVGLIGKIYFPRMIVPAAATVMSLVDFLIGLGILGAMLIYFQYLPSANVVFLPLFIILALVLSLGPGLFFAALNVKYRDFRYIVPFVVQFGIYVSPIAYSSNVVPDHWRLMYSLNPLVGVVDGFRWCLFGSESSPLYLPAVAFSVLFAILFLALGLRRFRVMERDFADII